MSVAQALASGKGVGGATSPAEVWIARGEELVGYHVWLLADDVAAVGSQTTEFGLHLVRRVEGALVCDCTAAAFRRGSECHHRRAVALATERAAHHLPLPKGDTGGGVQVSASLPSTGA